MWPVLNELKKNSEYKNTIKMKTKITLTVVLEHKKTMAKHFKYMADYMISQ